ncbi:hypothetical protein [Streptomyces aureus]|uniref:hypothetical protein n=1 Tax=Streptomyces aureus TaxID=193461 RepID=UPI0006E21EC4|nr:hypothetical protein [Streptomyces aureus]
MIAVAVLLLPVMGLLLFMMDRFENRVAAAPKRARHARQNHLRLVEDPGRSPGVEHDAGHADAA